MRSLAAVQDAINLAHRFAEGETFRPYVMKRLPIIVPVLAFFLALSIGCAAATLFAFSSMRTWLILPALLLAPAVLVGSLFLQVYLFFCWLEGRALARALGRRLTRRRMLAALPVVPWGLAAAVLLVPLSLLAFASPLLALVLLLLAASAPFLYDSLDR